MTKENVPEVRRIKIAAVAALLALMSVIGGGIAASGHTGYICYHGDYYNSSGWNEIYEGSYNLYGVHYHKYRHYHSYGTYPTHWKHKACSGYH